MRLQCKGMRLLPKPMRLSGQFGGIDFLDEMRKLNRVLLFGRFTDGSGGLVIYEAETREEVEAWVKEDPYITLGARDYSIHEWDMQTDHEFVRKS